MTDDEHENAYQRLFAVPKNEILTTLLSGINDEDEIILELARIRGEEVHPDDLPRASHSELVWLAEANEHFTEDTAVHLHEEFRYRGTKTLYLFTYPSEEQTQIDQAIQQENAMDNFARVVNRAYADVVGDNPNPKYSALQLRESDRFDVNDENFWELVYSYIAIIRTTDPETERARFHRDLRLGFMWVNRTTAWIVISTKDQAITAVLLRALQLFFGVPIQHLPIPKSAEIAVERYENVRRASHVDDRGVRIRVSHQDLHQFQDEMEDLQQRDQNQSRTSSGYNAEINGIEFAIGYSREKGALTFSKLLRTSQLRRFGSEKISQVYRAIQELREQAPEEVVPFITGTVLAGYRSKTKELVEEIVSKLIAARQSGLNEIQLEADPLQMASLSSKYFSLSAAIQCEDCDDLQNIQCNSCGAERFLHRDDQLVCSRCDYQVALGEVWCVMGHEGYVESEQDVVTLYPSQSLLTVVEEILSGASLASFNRHEEGFYIRGSSLHVFGSHGERTVYLMEDIPEFHAPALLDLTPLQESEAVVALHDYREKCTEMSNESCRGCVEHRVSPRCMMRLFGLYDRRYTPRPHHGGEFGDVSLSATIEGRQDQVLAILLKSGNPGGHPVTIRHSIGRDIYTQLDAFWNDQRVDVLGISVPQPIEDGFASRLQRLARQSGKKLVFLGTKELSKIVQHIVDRDGLNIADL